MMIPAPVFSQNMMMPMGQNTTVPVEQTTHYKRYHGDGIDDVLRLVPTASVFGLKMLGVEAESSWKRRIAVSVLSFGALVRRQCGCNLFAQEVDTQDETRWD